MKTYLKTLALIAATSFTMVLGACDEAADEPIAQTADDLEFGQFALEADNAGFTEEGAEEDGEDSMEGFFAEDETAEAEEDVIEKDEEVDAAEAEIKLAGKGAAVYRVKIVWGQFPAAPNLVYITEWKGAVAAVGGKVFLRRLVLFENKVQDKALPCKGHKCVLINTHTRPHRDGVVLTVVVPAKNIANFKLAIKFKGLYQRLLTAADLEQMADVDLVDEIGNKVAIKSHKVDLNPMGFMHGFWKRLNKKGGIFAGKFKTVNGDVAGKLAGLWGKRKNGNRVLFGMYLDKDGGFKGIIKGHYGPVDELPTGEKGGIIHGRWFAKGDKKAGALKGTYHVDEAGKGSFQGVWGTLLKDKDPKVKDKPFDPSEIEVGGMVPEEEAPADDCIDDCLENGYMYLDGDMGVMVEEPTEEECTDYCADQVDESNGGSGPALDGECTDDCMNGCEYINPGASEDEELWSWYCGCLSSCGCGC